MAVSTDADEKTVEVKEQEKYRGDQSLSVLILLGLFAVLAAALLQLIFVLRSSAAPPPTFFAVNEKEQLMKKVPLDIPSMEENVLLNWVVQVAMSANTFNYKDYPRIMSDVRQHFTKAGYGAFTTAIANEKIIERLVENKLVMSAEPMDSPYVVLEKPFSGRYMWKVKIPMLFRYQSIGYSVNDYVEIVMVIMRVPTEQSPIGIQIVKYDYERPDMFGR